MKVQARSAPLAQPQLSPPSLGQARTARTGVAQDGFLPQAGQASRAGRSADVQATFRQQFGELAADPKKFHDTLRTVFGEGYDAKQAESYRQKALAGDFSWLPPVKWVSAETLQGANGAYDSE